MIYQNRWIFILLVLISCSLIAGCGGDEEMEAVSTPKIAAVGSIQGTVSPAVGNAEVQLLKDGQPIATTRADANGRYAFTDLQPDTYEIRVVAAGYKPHSPQTVTVVAATTQHQAQVPAFRILAVPFYKRGILLSIPAFMIITVLVIAFTSNAVNLTDGMDGLASGCTALCGFAFMMLTYMVGDADLARSLLLPHIPQAGELAILCGAIYSRVNT